MGAVSEQGSYVLYMHIDNDTKSLVKLHVIVANFHNKAVHLFGS